MKRLLVTAAALSMAGPAYADALIDNVNGVTLDDQGAPLRFTGIVITREGRVVRLLQQGEKRPERPDWRADLKGKTVLPGFVDAHGHLLELGFGALTLDLAGTKSLDEALAKIAAYAAANPERKWILGRGWNQEQWGLGRFPTNTDLDKAVRDRPVWLERADGHAAWANSAAMAAAGVSAKSVAPAGGRIEKANGMPSGVFVDAAKALVERAVPQPLPKERALALEKAQVALLSVGVTATADMGTTLDDLQTLRRAGDLGALRVRVMSYGAGLEDTLRIGVTGPTPWLYGGKLKLVGVKLYADGALGSRGAWLKAPYADAAGQRGAGFYTDAQLKNLMSRAAMDGYQVAVHAIGDAANAQVLSAIEDLAETYAGDRRWRIEHAQIVDPAEIGRAHV